MLDGGFLFLFFSLFTFANKNDVPRKFLTFNQRCQIKRVSAPEFNQQTNQRTNYNNLNNENGSLME